MRYYLWEYPVDGMAIEEAVEKLTANVHSGKRSRVVTLNPEMVMAAERCSVLRKAILRADMVIPDGIGITWALNRQGVHIPRLTGIDLAEELMSNLGRDGGSVYLLGGRPGVAEHACLRISRQFPGLRIAGYRGGYFSAADEPDVVGSIRRARPHLLLVGMGTPRQDIWLAEYWDTLAAPIGIGIGGGIDIWAGQVRRAPKICRDLGLEWLCRGLVQPGRWLRLSRLPVFVWRVYRTSLGKQG